MPVTRIERKPAPRDDNVAASTRGHALIDALPWPCIVFNRGKGDSLGCNPAFLNEFTQWREAPTRSAFESDFDHVGEQDGHQLYYAPASRRWYRIERRELMLDGAVEAVFLTNMSECIESLRRHREQHEQLLSTSRMMSVGEMATTLAHELNQPLGAAINYLAGCEQLAESNGHERLLQGVRLAKRQTERAAQIIGSAQTIVSRKLDISELPAVLSFGIVEGGARYNIVPDKVELQGTLRTFDAGMRQIRQDGTYQRILADWQLADEQSAAHGSTLQERHNNKTESP